jgi:hypothetical protein
LDFLYKRSVPAWIVAIIVMGMTLFTLIIAHLVQRKGEDRYTPAGLDDAAWALASVPQVIRRAITDQDAQSAVVDDKLPPGLFYPADNPERDAGHLLITHWDETIKKRTIRLLRLSDGTVIKTYDVKRRFSRIQPELLMSAFLMPDGGLVYHDMRGMNRVDACGREIWRQIKVTHHSIERNHEGNIWAPVWIDLQSGNGEYDGADALLLLSPKGQPLYEKRVDAIFADNGLSWIVQGRKFNPDPFHLNDIEPVLKDGPHWKQGDVFLSLRDLSMVALFRPQTGKVLWWKIGPWLNQHDVQILDDNRIGLFDNHAASGRRNRHVIGTSRHLTYDFARKTLTSDYEQGFKMHRVVAPAQGRSLVLDNRDLFVEETGLGRILRFDQTGKLKWRYIAANTERERYPLGWTRYLDPDEFGSAIAKATSATCPQS